MRVGISHSTEMITRFERTSRRRKLSTQLLSSRGCVETGDRRTREGGVCVDVLFN